MQIYEVKPLHKGIDYGVTGIEEVLQNVAFILATTVFECPLDREFGWEPAIDSPIDQAEAENVENILDAIEAYEPRAIVTEITAEPNQLDGNIKLFVKVGVDLERSNESAI